MAEISAPLSAPAKKSGEKTKGGTSTLARVAKYTLVRVLTLSITVVIGLYLTILIANMGGYVDKIRAAQIREDVNMRAAGDQAMRNLAPEVRASVSPI